MQRARAGDAGAFHQLADRHMGELFRVAVMLVGHRADAEDVVQETLLGAYQGLIRFEGRAAPRTWLMQILVRQAARKRRYRYVRRTGSLDAASGSWVSGASGGGDDEAVSPALRTGSARDASDLRIDLAAALQTLSPEHRQVIVLRELHGLSYEELAETLGVPRGTIESRLFRARQALREPLKDYQPRTGNPHEGGGETRARKDS